MAPDDGCEAILSPVEWNWRCRQFEPENRSNHTPTRRQAVRWMAQLGEFLARPPDGEPGLKPLWRGLGVLHPWLEGATLCSALSPESILATAA